MKADEKSDSYTRVYSCDETIDDDHSRIVEALFSF